MKFENTKAFNFEGAIRGMRNPMNSWDKSDSGYYGYCPEDDKWVKEPCSYDACLGACVKNKKFQLGKNDLELAQTLIKSGSEHRKFMRQIFVSVDITAPRYWWIELDTYKVGTVADSCSTMHTITNKKFEPSDFEFGFVDPSIINSIIENLETLRTDYITTDDVAVRKGCWYSIIQMLPQSYLQKRTVTMNYENILNMCRQRRNHKLTEWSKSFIDWARSLPYAQELIFIDEVTNESKT